MKPSSDIVTCQTSLLTTAFLLAPHHRSPLDIPVSDTTVAERVGSR
jgi:hypothetical protein